MKNRFTQYVTFFTILFTITLFPAISEAGRLAIPLAPLNLTAVAVSPAQITLTWQDASVDETGFEVEGSSDNKTFFKIADLPVNSITYASVGLAASRQFWYRVRAKNASGFSLYSNIATATTKMPVITIPKPPTNLLITLISGTQINLIWTDNATDETGFELERSPDGVNFTKLAELPVNSVSFQNTGLTPVTKYWYRVLAKNTAGSSAYSNLVSATTLQVLPAAPESLAAVAVSTSQINLTWSDKSNNEAGFQLERSLDGITFARIADLAVNVVAYQNTGLAPATEYYYRVRAVNVIGPSAYSNIGSAKTQNIPVPDMPQDFTAVPLAPELIQLRWAAVTGNASEVVIERARDSDEVFVQIGKVAATVLQFEDKGKLEAADYYYRIKATNAGGSSPYSLISIVRASTIITGIEPVKDEHLIYAFGKTLVTELKNQSDANLSVYDVRGVRHAQLAIKNSSRTDLTTLPSGIYIVIIQTDREKISRKILLY